MSLSASIRNRLRALVLPPRPDPARSRRIAEVRLMLSAVLVVAVFSVIAGRVLLLATQEANARTAAMIQLPAAERGQILDRKGRLLATNLPIAVLHADPKEIMDPREAASLLAPLLPRHDEAALLRLLTKKTRYVELDRKLTGTSRRNPRSWHSGRLFPQEHPSQLPQRQAGSARPRPGRHGQ